MYISCRKRDFIMKVILDLLIIVSCCSALVFSKSIDNNAKKAVQTDSSVAIGTMKYSQGYYYGEFTANEGTMERKRSHKRRKAVRKPRRGRGQ